MVNISRSYLDNGEKTDMEAYINKNKTFCKDDLFINPVLIILIEVIILFGQIHQFIFSPYYEISGKCFFSL